MVPSETGMTQLVSKILPDGADRMELRILIEKIQQAEDENRGAAALMDGLLRNGKALIALLQNLGRWL